VLGAGTSFYVILGLQDSGAPPTGPWPLYIWYGGTLVDTGVTIAPGTWYSVELAAYRSSTNGWVKVWVNNGDANSPTWRTPPTGVNTGTSDFSRVRIGFNGVKAATTSVAYWDAVVVAASFIEPLP